MKPLKILYYIDSLNFGGVETLVTDWALRLDKSQFETIICINKDIDKSDVNWEENGIKKIVLNVDSYKKSRKSKLPSISRIYKNLKKINRCFLEERPDILHLHDFWTALFCINLAKKIGTPKIIIHTHQTIEGSAFNNPQNYLENKKAKKFFHNLQNIWIPKFFFRYIYKLVDKVVVISQETENDVIKLGAPESKIVKIFNGIDISNFDKNANSVTTKQTDTLKKKYGLTKTFPIIGLLGNIKAQKGYEYLIQAMPEIKKRLPHAKAIILGGWGDNRLKENKEKLDSLCCNLNVHNDVIFAGYQKPYFFIPMFDICLMTSIHEGMSVALLEFMAARKPVISTKVEGVSEVINHGENGIIVKPRDPKSIADAIIKVALDKTLSEKISHNARKSIEKEFTINQMLNKLKKLYTS